MPDGAAKGARGTVPLHPRFRRRWLWWLVPLVAVVLIAGGVSILARRSAPATTSAWLVAATQGGATALGPAGDRVSLRRCPPFCTNGDGSIVAWAPSPDGRALAWIRRDAANAGTERLTVDWGPGATASFDLPAPTHLPSAAASASPQASTEAVPTFSVPRLLWSPVGGALAVLPLEGPPLIYRVPTSQGRTPSPPPQSPPDNAPTGPAPSIIRLEAPSSRQVLGWAWSPDGMRLALMTGNRTTHAGVPGGAVLVADAATGRVLAQAYAVAPAPGVGWLGGKVVYAAYTDVDWPSGSTHDARLWTLAPGDQPQPGPLLPATWTPDRLAAAAGGAVVYLALAPVPGLNPARATQLWAYHVPDGRWRRLTRFTTGSSIVALRPDHAPGLLALAVGQGRGDAQVVTLWVAHWPRSPRLVKTIAPPAGPVHMWWTLRLAPSWSADTGWLPGL